MLLSQGSSTLQAVRIPSPLCSLLLAVGVHAVVWKSGFVWFGKALLQPCSLLIHPLRHTGVFARYVSTWQLTLRAIVPRTLLSAGGIERHPWCTCRESHKAERPSQKVGGMDVTLHSSQKKMVPTATFVTLWVFWLRTAASSCEQLYARCFERRAFPCARPDSLRQGPSGIVYALVSQLFSPGSSSVSSLGSEQSRFCYPE